MFSATSKKALHLGEAKGATHDFWLKIGDGTSAVSVASTTSQTYVRGGSVLIADKATLDFTGKYFNMYNTSAAYVTNTTMTAGGIALYGTSAMTFSGSSLTVTNDINVANAADASCAFTNVNGTLRMIGSGFVFNVGNGERSTGLVEKTGGDWDCYYLRIGSGSGSSGTFTQNGGTLKIRTQFQVGRAAGSTGAFTLNGGSVTALGSTVIANGSGSTGTLVINGGTLTASNIGATGMGRILLDDGTIRAGAAGTLVRDSSDLAITVGSGGATFDTAGFVVTVGEALDHAENVPGDLAVTGGGSATFSAGGNLAGAFAVGDDTELRWFDADAAVADYAISSLSLAPGATLALDADATGCDTFSAATTNFSTSAEKKTTFRLVVRSMPESGRAFPLFRMSEADAANCSVVAETPVGAPLRVEKAWADGFLTYAVLAADYVWAGGSNAGGWTAGQNWLVAGTASVWDDNNNAVFANAGDAAALDADVAAVALDFRANAMVGCAEGVTASLTVPEVRVAPGVSAALNAPVAGAFAKTGAGTLVLGADRAEQTTLAEGTLELDGTSSLDWFRLTLGTEAAKAVTLRFAAGATLAEIPAQWSVGTVANITSTVVKAGGDWTVGNVFLACAASVDTAFVHAGGTLTVTNTVDVGKASSAAHARFEIAGGTVYHAGYIHAGANGPGTVVVKKGAKYERTTAGGYGMIVGGNADARLDVAGGEVSLDGPVNFAYYGASGPRGVADVTDGGVLSCTKILVNDYSSGGSGALRLDGGTLRACADNAAFVPDKDNLTITVGANGGTVDANGKDIAFLKPILEDAGSPGGGMAFTGGGKITLAAGNTYTGATSVEVGTTVVVPAPGDILGDLVLTAPDTPLADGAYAVLAISGSETFAARALEGIAAPDGGRLVLSGDGRCILFICGNPIPTWIGGAAGSLSDGANWSAGVVPTGGSCIIGNPTEARLEVGDTFAAGTITFPPRSARVTISGARALTGLSAIVNDSAQHHVFACPVDARAATPDLPLANSVYLVFEGGIALSSMPSVTNMRLAGAWNLTGDWTEPPSGTSVMPGSTVTVSGTLRNGYNLVVNADATLQAAQATVTLGGTNKNRFICNHYGTLVVTGEMTDEIRMDATGAYSLVGLFANGNSNAVTRVNGLVHGASTQGNHPFRLSNSHNAATNTIVLGAGGLSFRDNHGANAACAPYFQVDSGKSALLASSADWSISANAFRSNGETLALAGNVTVDTSDFDDRAVGRVVRVLGGVGGVGSMAVKGRGRLAFEASSDFQGGLAVQDEATVSVNAGCTPGVGAVRVGAGATLEAAQSGTVALGGDLALADGACLGFNFTQNTPPVLDVTGKNVTFGKNGLVVVKISSSGGRRAQGGANVLTAGGKFAGATVSLAPGAPEWARGVSVVDGDIVLDVSPTGMSVIIR